MKCSLIQLRSALDFIKYNTGASDDASIEVTHTEENFEEGKVGSILTLAVSYTKPPSTYEAFSGDKTIKHTLEIFPDHEGVHPRLTTQETQVLIPRKSNS